MVLDIPNDLPTFQQVNLSSPVSDVFLLSPTIKPLEIRKSSPLQTLPPPPPPSQFSDCETASTRSRCSSNASSTKSYSTTTTSAFGDNEIEDIPVTKPLTRPSRPGSICGNFSPLSSVSVRSDSDSGSVLSPSSSSVSTPSVCSSSSRASFTSRRSLGYGPISLPPLPSAVSKLPSTRTSRRNSSIASPLPESRPTPAVSSHTSYRSSKFRSSDAVAQFDKSKHRPVSMTEPAPKSMTTSAVDLNDIRLSMIRDKAAAAGVWPFEHVPSSPREVEPPSSARRSDFGDEETCTSNTPPLPTESARSKFGPAVILQLTQTSVVSPQVVPKLELPTKKLRWDTRRQSVEAL